MQRSISRPLLLAAVVALLAPPAAATWYSYGTFEPDNSLDSSDFMRVDPPGTAQNLIYFNVWTSINVATVRGISVSPNVGLLETGQEPHGFESHMALLGVWRDCNGDGYIGMAETAVREYPSQLLSESTVCPPVSGPTTEWPVGAHNYNGWVSELVPIGGQNAVGGGNESSDLRVYKDVEAMIWGDAGTPDGRAGAGSCPIAPQPRGTYQTTGGLLNYADCHADREAVGGLGLMESGNRLWEGGRLLGLDLPGIGDPLGLTFENEDNASGSWADRPTLGSEAAENSPVFLYDCDGGQGSVGATLDSTPAGPLLTDAVATVGDEDLQEIYDDERAESFPVVDPRVNDGDVTSWTVPGLVNHTFEGTNLSGESIRGSADCDTSNDAGHDLYGISWATFYVGETEFNPISGVNKREADFNFQFQWWDRGHTVAGIGPNFFLEFFDQHEPTVDGTPTGNSGIALPGKFFSNWNPGRTALKVDNNRFVRTDVQEGTAGFPDAQLFTFYAHVGSTTLQRGFLLPSGSSATYGHAQCDGFEGTINPSSGWNCDPTKWYANPDGSPTVENLPRARPGQAYEMRDVDCHDGRSQTLGVGLQPAFYGESPCEAYSG